MLIFVLGFCFSFHFFHDPPLVPSADQKPVNFPAHGYPLLGVGVKDFVFHNASHGYFKAKESARRGARARSGWVDGWNGLVQDERLNAIAVIDATGLNDEAFNRVPLLFQSGRDPFG